MKPTNHAIFQRLHDMGEVLHAKRQSWQPTFRAQRQGASRPFYCDVHYENRLAPRRAEERYARAGAALLLCPEQPVQHADLELRFGSDLKF